MFYSCDEGPNENVDHWVNRLRQLLKSCNFEAMIDSLLRDRVVMGIKYKAARAQMFREKVVNVNETVDMLRASEVAAQHIKDIDQGTSDEVVSVCIVQYAYAYREQLLQKYTAHRHAVTFKTYLVCRG